MLAQKAEIKTFEEIKYDKKNTHRGTALQYLALRMR